MHSLSQEKLIKSCLWGQRASTRVRHFPCMLRSKPDRGQVFAPTVPPNFGGEDTPGSTQGLLMDLY